MKRTVLLIFTILPAIHALAMESLVKGFVKAHAPVESCIKYLAEGHYDLLYELNETECEEILTKINKEPSLNAIHHPLLSALAKAINFNALSDEAWHLIEAKLRISYVYVHDEKQEICVADSSLLRAKVKNM